MLIKNYFLTNFLSYGSNYMKICGVKFKDNGKIYNFKYDEMPLKKDLNVVVDTEKGEQLAKVVVVDVAENKNVNIDEMKSIIRIGTDEDYKAYEKNLKDSQEALKFARELAKKENCEMNLLDASFTLDRKQLSFNFIADERIDFRELVKGIAAKYKTRIELHQIGVRDKSKEIGGLGVCGRELCCASHLKNLETISINMAKNQNIALNPSKINGACGRLLCCLAYEDDVYTDHRQMLPKVGQMVHTPDGDAKVVSLDVLNKKYSVIIEGEKKDYDAE